MAASAHCFVVVGLVYESTRRPTPPRTASLSPTYSASPPRGKIMSGSALLQVKNLSARLGAAQLLFDVDFEAHAGEVLVLVGRNGAGKSTTMKAIMGLARGVAGEISFAGQSIVGLAPHTIARMGLGYVPEERRIFTDLTVTENLEVGRIPSRANATDAPRWTVDR
ncbi:MAG: ATP-binding cassette domain-containing protein, partial [Casimicrobium sp.]